MSAGSAQLETLKDLIHLGLEIVSHVLLVWFQAVQLCLVSFYCLLGVFCSVHDEVNIGFLVGKSVFDVLELACVLGTDLNLVTNLGCEGS